MGRGPNNKHVGCQPCVDATEAAVLSAAERGLLLALNLEPCNANPRDLAMAIGGYRSPRSRKPWVQPPEPTPPMDLAAASSGADSSASHALEVSVLHEALTCAEAA